MLLGFLIFIIIFIMFFKYAMKNAGKINNHNLEKLFNETDYYAKCAGVKENNDTIEPYLFMVNKNKSSGVIIDFDSFKNHYSFFSEMLQNNQLMISRRTYKGVVHRYSLEFVGEKIEVYPHIAINDYAGAYRDVLKDKYPSIHFIKTNDLKNILQELQIAHLL